MNNWHNFIMGVINNLSFLTYIAHFGHLPKLEIRRNDEINEEEAREVLADYKRLEVESMERGKRGRAKWAGKISIEDIIYFSSYKYWPILDAAQKNENLSPNEKVVMEFQSYFGDKTEEYLINNWMLHNLHKSRVHTIMPGFISEYIRRFEKQDHINNGYDKLLHFLWGAVIPRYIGENIGTVISFASESLDLPFVGYKEARADFKAFKKGIKFSKKKEIYEIELKRAV